MRAAIDEIYRYPLRESAKDTLNRQLRSGIDNEQLAQLVVDLRTDDRLCIVQDESEQQEPQKLEMLPHGSAKWGLRCKWFSFSSSAIEGEPAISSR